MTVPGVVAGWTALAEAHGTPGALAAALRDAAELAEDGATVSAGLARAARERAPQIAADPGLSALLTGPDGVPLDEGDPLPQPRLAAVLRTLADDPSSFYRGAVAEALANGLRRAGSSLTAGDLAAHQAADVEPLTLDVAGTRWWTAPPPSQGASLLAVLETAASVAKLSEPERTTALAARCQDASAARDLLLGDPLGPAPLDLDGLLHPAPLAGAEPPEPSFRPAGDTVAITTVDASGLAVSLIQSVYQTFGSGICDPETGIVLHNRGSAFSLLPGHPALIGPGLRPPHTLCPVLGRSAELLLAAGCQGGRAQPQILAQTVPDLMDPAADPAAVLDRRRGAGPHRSGRSHPGRTTVRRRSAGRRLRSPRRRRHHLGRKFPVSTLAPEPVPAGVPHPLDPLTVAELATAVGVLRADTRVPDDSRFWGVALDEDHARRAAPGDTRRARAVVFSPSVRHAFEVDLELGDKPQTTAWRELDVRSPGCSSEEARQAAAACRADPRFREALALRGIHDVSLVMVDPESIGGFEPPEYAGRRLTWGSVWHRTDEDDNGYARPVQGVVPIIDMETMEILHIEDHGVIPLSEESGVFSAGTVAERPGLKPLEVVQPDGPSFTVTGQRIDWQGWSVRVGFSHREGLVLHDLAFTAAGKGPRQVIRRAAVNEMYVPYFDTASTQYRKNFFDWGEYGAGPLTNSLALGCDCLGVIQYFDAAVLGGDGVPRLIPNAVCVHEEDDGILWKHHDGRTGRTEVRRSRRLIISAFATVANYDYGFYW
ncbi:gamma-glutamyltransferase, partial [Streptomyces sp. MBT65]|uniref:copper amine oxidase n=1 Tax=Streptomyces sp. MBT65 TaxID=1488395 RepID=UPI0027DA5661